MLNIFKKIKLFVITRMGLTPFLLFVFVVTILFASCSEPPERIHYKLNEALQDDLKYIVAEIKSKTGNKSLLDSPYYVINDLRMFHGDSAWKISAYAEVDFFYFKNQKMFQKRKFRYLTKKRMWDRYYKKLSHIGELKKTKE